MKFLNSDIAFRAYTGGETKLFLNAPNTLWGEFYSIFDVKDELLELYSINPRIDYYQEIDGSLTGNLTTYCSGIGFGIKNGSYAVEVDVHEQTYKFIPTPNVKLQIGADQIIELLQQDADGNYFVSNVEINENQVIVLKVWHYGIAEEETYEVTLVGKKVASKQSANKSVTVTPGIYDVYFNAKTKEYQFEEKALITSEFEKQNITFYPNPTQGKITFTEKVDAVKVFDLSGRLVKSIIVNTTEVDLSDLQNGVYALQATQNQKVLTAKVVKE